MYKINNSIPVFMELVQTQLYNDNKVYYYNLYECVTKQTKRFPFLICFSSLDEVMWHNKSIPRHVGPQYVLRKL